MELKVPAFFADQIRHFMKVGRKNILAGTENRYLLVTPSCEANQAIDKGHFSNLIKSCNRRVSNKPIGAQLMRDMAVTSLMEKPDLTEAESKSWAAAMQHSVTAQRKIYDRTSGHKRVAPACLMASDLFEKSQKRARTTRSSTR